LSKDWQIGSDALTHREIGGFQFAWNPMDRGTDRNVKDVQQHRHP
jgi:hypothetical protein